MPISTMPSIGYDLEYATSLAMYDKISGTPAVDRERSSIYMLHFIEPVSDHSGRGRYTHGLLFLTRGRMGRYSEAATLVACDETGVPLADDPNHPDGSSWILLLDGQAHISTNTASAFADRHGLPV